MATLKMERNELWEVNSRTIVYAAIGAALYGILLVAQIPIPGTTVSVRPAFALVPFFGYAFGPIVGFFTGLVGNAVGDQISGWGPLTSWNWSIANGLVGLIAGLAPMYLARWVNGNIRERAIGGAVAGAIAVVIGFLFVFTDLILQSGNDGRRTSDVLLHHGHRRRPDRDDHPGSDPRVRLGAGEAQLGR